MYFNTFYESVNTTTNKGKPFKYSFNSISVSNLDY